MRIRAGIVSIGAGIAAFLIAFAIASGFAGFFDVPVRIVGLAAGMAVGLLGSMVTFGWYYAIPAIRRTGIGLATFGYVTLLVLVLGQAIPALSEYLTTAAVAVVGTFAAALVWARVTVRELTTG
jgi:hypothetical protein